MKWVGTFAALSIWTGVGLAGAFDLRGCTTYVHKVGRDFWEGRGVPYRSSVAVLRAAMGVVAVIGFVLIGFGIAAATGLYVAPNN
jgi:hypothetical protein